MTAAQVFLGAVGVVFLGGFGLPLLLAPRRWADWLRWAPEDGQLLRYFGRCLGACAVAITVIFLRSLGEPARHPALLELTALAAALLGAVHVWGWWRREQPWSETAEIFVYAVVAAVATALRLGA